MRMFFLSRPKAAFVLSLSVHGSVKLKSKLDKGTTITVTLPRS